MKEFLESFLNEANDIISHIESMLFKIEKDGGAPGAIEEIFRGMHTLKGAAGMYGYNKTGELTHELETVYDLIRENKTKLDDSIINVTYTSIDVLRCLLKNEEKTCPQEYDDLKQKLFSINGKQKEGETEENSMVHENEQNKLEKHLYYIYFNPNKEIFQRGLDPRYAIEDLRELGETEEILHDNGIPFEKQCEEKICNSFWEIYLLTNVSIDEINDILLFFNEDEFDAIELESSNYKENNEYLEVLKLIYNDDIPWENIDSIINVFSPSLLKESVEYAVKDEKIEPESIKEVEAIQNTNTFEDSGILVSSRKLDEMMNLVSDFVIRYAELENAIEPYKENTRLIDILERMEKLSKRFRDNALSIRLVPLNSIFQHQQRLVRDLSNQLDKKVDFIVEGLDTELDKSIISVLEKPLLHIIRNSIDHGIESSELRLKNNKPEKGLLRLMSYYSGVHVVIQIQDDGAGIDLEKVKKKAIQRGIINEDDKVTEEELLKIIVTPGFSTADKVSMISGRGVGMDVVQKEISSIRGELEINTEKGLGTIITLKIPITLSIIDTLLIEAGTMRFLVPLSEVELCYHISKKKFIEKNNKQIEYEQDLIPFINLHQIFNIPDEKLINYRVLIIKKNDNKYAIITEKIIGEHQAVLKPLGDLFKNQEYFSGVSILGDGRLAYVLDTVKLAFYSEQKLKIS